MSNSDRYALVSYVSMIVGAWATHFIGPQWVTSTCLIAIVIRFAVGYAFDRFTKGEKS